MIYLIEWKKRGLIHVHILLWLKNKVHSNQIDDLFSAKLPYSEKNLELFKIVKNNT